MTRSLVTIWTDDQPGQLSLTSSLLRTLIRGRKKVAILRKENPFNWEKDGRNLRKSEEC